MWGCVCFLGWFILLVCIVYVDVFQKQAEVKLFWVCLFGGIFTSLYLQCVFSKAIVFVCNICNVFALKCGLHVWACLFLA